MDIILNFLRTDTFLIILACINIILVVLYITNIVKQSKIRKEQIKFNKKLGNSVNIEEVLKKYFEKVEDVEYKNQELMKYCHNLDSDMTNCIQKIGIVRYSAFKDTGSDLSFALALLDEKDNGVVLNGIYSREISNIYAKPIENGKSSYTLSGEEEEAIFKAKTSEQTHKIRE